MELFAQRGVSEVSNRDLTAHAGVNIAAINYHFRTRAGLEEAVYEEVAVRVNERRRAALAGVLADAAASRAIPGVEAILETFIAPYFGSDANEGALLAQLILKHRIAPTPLTVKLIRAHFDPMAREYVAAFALANPDIDPQAFVWRYMFVTSAVVLTATDRHEHNRVKTISGGALDANHVEPLRAALMAFLVAGLRAPSGLSPRK